MIALDHFLDQAFDLQLIEHFLLAILLVNDFVEFEILHGICRRALFLINLTRVYSRNNGT